MSRTRSETVSHSHSISEMVSVMRKPQDPFWTARLLVRPWSPYVSALLAKLGMTANQVSAASGVMMIVGCLFLASTEPRHWIVGTALVFLHHIFDHFDGEIARYHRHTGERPGSPGGMYWDAVIHGLEVLMIACVGFRLYLTSGLSIWPLVLIIPALLRYGIAPYPRACEALLTWGRDRGEVDGDRVTFDLPAWALEKTGEAAERDWFTERSWKPWVHQALIFPGYFFTLPIATALDLMVGPFDLAAVGLPGARLYWIGLWLIQVVAGKIASAVFATRRYGRLLSRIQG